MSKDLELPQKKKNSKKFQKRELARDLRGMNTICERRYISARDEEIHRLPIGAVGINTTPRRKYINGRAEYIHPPL